MPSEINIQKYHASNWRSSYLLYVFGYVGPWLSYLTNPLKLVPYFRVVEISRFSCRGVFNKGIHLVGVAHSAKLFVKTLYNP